ncbi:bromodomain adjacent to zinc finger domain protein 1A [Scaptodrosophila lebanonensis]|uniref:Bromodomain adjacent to zinc finger domain protein 1A n=1 Tax=Drosophila lebanonensis TaxID=7225 RepID=A0A6J2T4B5_DROLE|nr:bromodomain adjacent to zinc finger domain protein 1A [Scaptodrosophila lebanonensis]
MPICKREGFDLNQSESKHETFHDNDLVFCCYITKRIFRDYEDYFRHVMVINSTVWQCEATGRDSLTYEEALKSERVARKKMEQFKQSLRAPTLLVIEHARQSAVKTLHLIVTKFLRKRYFLNEEVTTLNKKNISYIVVGIKPPKNAPEPANGVYENTEDLEYRLREVKGDESTEITVPFEQLRRLRMEFTNENLQMYIKNNVTRVDGILRPKPDVYKQYVTDRKITFSSIFIGKMPRYSPAKIKRPDQAPSKDTKKQATLNKYLVKGDEANKEEPSTVEQQKNEKAAKAKSLQAEMERMRLEKIEKLAEKERQKAEKKAQLLERVETECNNLLTKTDDLERSDQRLLPIYRPIITHVPVQLLGDGFMLREFMHSYAGLLSGIEVFRQNLSFYEMSRALTAREVAGPLSDILLILLGTVFDLQKEEEEECPHKYLIGYGPKDREPYRSMSDATRSHFYAERHFSFKINELPLDALTLSEVLRLHLLSSGAAVTERAEKWRVMYRNGYSSREDPGLELRMQHAHILRALKNYSIYQFSFVDIMRVIRCLMAQILTYSGTINVIEERMEQAAKARIELRTLVAAENRRVAAVDSQKRKMTNEYNQQCMTDELKSDAEKKKTLGDKLNRRIAELLALSDRERRKHETQVLSLRSQLFNFLVYLGSDRCYRKYYVLESIPGIFIEHPPDSMDICLNQPPQNKTQADIRNLAELPTNRKNLRTYLLKLYGDERKRGRRSSKPEVPKQSLENKENQEHRVNGLSKSTSSLTNGTHPEASVDDPGVETDVAACENEDSPTQYQLLMCSGDKRNCIVHNDRNAGRQRWAYIYKPEEIEALVNALNPLGWRESSLRDELTSLRSLIEQHVKNCPVDLLSLEDEKRRQSFRNAMHQETHRKYGKANFGLPDDTDLSEVMQLHLIDRILQFESDIYTGDLGRLKVKDMQKWRDDLLNRRYDPQGKLQWGPIGIGVRQTGGANQEEDVNSENGSTYGGDEEDGELEAESAEPYVSRAFGSKPYRDPGEQLGPTLEIESEDSADDDVPLLESEELQSQVHKLASALLQVEQAIEKRFLKEPYGVTTRETNKEKLELKQRAGQARLKQWEVSLMESTSFAQVFLHLNILHDCIMWARSTNKSLCSVCRRGSDPEKMLLCDECNGGTHMFCMKPKMRTVPDGNWYCGRCVKNLGLKNEVQPEQKKRAAQKKRKFIVEEDEELADEEQNDEDNNEEQMDVSDNTSEASSANVKSAHKRRASGRRSGRQLKSKEIEQELDEDDEEAEEEPHSDDEQMADESDVAESDNGDDENNEEIYDKDAEESEVEEEKICMICWYDGSEVCCARCNDWYHLECEQLKRRPRADFVCKKCKGGDTRRRPRQNADGDADDDGDDEPHAKRSRSFRTSLRISMQNGEASEKSSTRHSNNNNNSTSNNNNRRSGRRTNDNLPLNSAALYDLLEQTMKHKSAWPFLRPVLSSEVPDYHKIIKSPMDLAKVKSKLNMGAYQINEELLNDIQLVFRNCDLYNVQGNEIYDAGSQLERFVIARCKDLQLPFKPSDMNAEAIC